METIKEAFDKVIKKQKISNQEIDDSIEKMISSLSSEIPGFQEITRNNQKLSEQIKEYYSVFQKLSKAVDKKFKTDLDSIWDPKSITKKEDLSQILVQHFVREGRFDLAQIFAKEAGIEFEQTLYTQYVEMFHIQEALRSKNPDLAIQWASKYSHSLRDSGSSLEFNLHKVKYVTLVKSLKIPHALEYAKKYFPIFADTQLKCNNDSFSDPKVDVLFSVYQKVIYLPLF
jgi:hypothetical protein